MTVIHLNTKERVVVGNKYKVGEFFWIDHENFLGMSSRFAHGNCDDHKYCGSMDIYDLVEVRKHFKENLYVVEKLLSKNGMPYGARSAIGTLFLITEEQILSWKEKLETLDYVNQQKQDLIRDLI